MAIRYGKGLMGGAVVIALLALLVHWIGINTIEHYRDDLLFYLQAHLILVLASMLAALVVGIPAGIFLSRPTMVGRAERFMQIFNIGNTVPPLAVLAIALGILGIGSGPAIFALFLASLLPIVRNTYEGLKNVQGSLKEAAVGIGMNSSAPSFAAANWKFNSPSFDARSAFNNSLNTVSMRKPVSSRNTLMCALTEANPLNKPAISVLYSAPLTSGSADE